ncbi:hydrogenase expression/formation protein [Caldichromatium japonicum]|uniref:Hydrogenase expression/formation protein n=1 Tax=Caldichromatium japonicum TaxID=2699430 RepID=A0A6G7VB63_9GAMM|nr:hydrogenase expression/formation protein [Caldichromatium japonicum]QIK37313.1 hydrogenase expression/formation protein [Caldichromatium japonicum]
MQVEEPSALALSLLQEIRHALGRLIAQREETRIELQALLLGPAEIQMLESVLGRGEVEARVEALGPTLVCETAIPGVWWLSHQDTEGRVLSRQIEVAAVPAILQPSPDDLAESLARLDNRLHAYRA